MPSFWLSLSFVCGYIVWLRFGVWCGRLLVVATKDVVVRVRVDAATKVLWVQSAGGDQLLSRWVRERCNAAVTERDLGIAQVPEGVAAQEGKVQEGLRPDPASRSVTAANCPQRLLSHVPGTECPKCHTVFPPTVAPVVREKVFRTDFKKDVKR